ncbi:DUF1648 domain-containing protein [Peribacillus sp. NPDC097206]|uniref:DUF1648 domain-containing protein n=1 Tax=Peribacillus sp. NPDC097206 TaxID=3364398 RepID=UPI003830E3C5
MDKQQVTTKKTFVESLLDSVSMILLIMMFVYIFLKWPVLPNSIPMSFDPSGAVSQWGGKKSILGLPLIGLLAFGVFSLVERYPDSINLRIYKSEDKDKEVTYNRLMVNIIKTGIVICLLLANWRIMEAVL